MDAAGSGDAGAAGPFDAEVEMLFQAGHRLGHGGLGDAERLGRVGKAAMFDHGGEHRPGLEIREL